VTVGDEVRARRASPAAERPAGPGAAGLRPVLVAHPDAASGNGLILFPRADSLPAVWAGPVSAGLDPDDVAMLLAAVRPCPLLPQHAEGWFGRPGLSGHRLGAGAGGPAAGRDWSPLFLPVQAERDGHRAVVEAEDKAAGLRLVTKVEAVPGGAIRARHILTNLGTQPYLVDSLEVVFPLPGRIGEILDFTGRQTAERIPQRHQIGNGLWLREGRRGHTGHDSATVLVADVPGFAFATARCTGCTSPGAATPCTGSSACRPTWA
jgi:alpha-galactosidase